MTRTFKKYLSAMLALLMVLSPLSASMADEAIDNPPAQETTETQESAPAEPAPPASEPVHEEQTEVVPDEPATTDTPTPVATDTPTPEPEPTPTDTPTPTPEPTDTPTPAPTQEPLLDHFDTSDLQTEYVVAYGTSLAEVVAKLPATLTAVYTDNSSREVSVVWTCVSGTYDPECMQFDREFTFEATMVGNNSGIAASVQVKFDPNSITDNEYITISTSAQTITITGQVTTDQIHQETGFSSAYRIIVEASGSITGGNKPISNDVQNYGIISGGTFTGKVTNENTLSGGSFTGPVYNHGLSTQGASITGLLMENTGTVTTDGMVVNSDAKTVTISSGYSFTTDQISNAIGGSSSYVIINDGTISGGSVTLTNNINTGRGSRSSGSDSRRSGYISGGNFSGEVYADTISGGSFSGRTHAFTINGGTFTNFVGDAPDGLYALTINGGTFNCPVGTRDDTIIINGGTFNGAIETYNLGVKGNATFGGSVFFTVGDIRSGTFNGQVTNNGCSISGGTFNGNVVNNATIHGGTFTGGIDNKGTIRSTGTFKYTVGTALERDADGKVTKWQVTTHSEKLEDAYINCHVNNSGTIEVSAKTGPNFSVSGSGSCSVPAFMASTDGTYSERMVPYGANVMNTLRSIAPAKTWKYISGAAIPQNATFSLNALDNTFVGDESYKIEGGVLIVDVPLNAAPSANYSSVRVTSSGSITGGDWTAAPVSVEGGSVTGGTLRNVTLKSGSITGATINGEIYISGGKISDCSYGVSAVVRQKTGGEIYISIRADGQPGKVLYGENVKNRLLSSKSPAKHDWYRVSSPFDYEVGDSDTFRLVDNGAVYVLKERKHPPILWPTDAKVILGNTLSTATYTKADTNGTFTWEDGNKVPASGTHDYYMIYTPYPSNKNFYEYTTAECRKAVPVEAKGDVVIISVTSFTVGYGANYPKLTASVQGEKNGKKVSYTLKREPGDDVGTYQITAELGYNPGYEVTVVPGTFTITPRSVSDYNNCLLSTSYPYTGDPITPQPQLAVTSKPLVPGVDFTATYENNINAGTGYMNVHGIGNYTGDARIGFKITKGNATIKVNSATKEFGAPDPEFSATVSGVGSSEKLSYSFSRSSGEKAGTYTINAIPGNNPNFNVFVEAGKLTITAKQIPATITPPSAQPYTGAALTPKPVVMDGSKVLAEGVDYALSYSNNINVGTGSITVTGKGDYTGSQTVRFTITKGKASITANAISKVTGDPDPVLTATVTGASSSDQLHYTLKRDAGEKAGSYAIRVTLGSNPNYDVETHDGTFTIGQKNLPATITVAAQTYTGSALTPKPVVRDGSRTLTEGQDYDLSYENNVEVGTATVNLAGRGDYAGMRSATFAIQGAPATITIDPASKLYGESDPQFTASTSGTLNGEILNYSLRRDPGEAAGSYTIRADLGSNPHYDVRVVTAQLTIGAKGLPVNIASPANVVYTGSPATPEVEVREGSTRLRANVDYTLSYSNNVNVGTATVTVTGKGSYSGSSSVTFQITKASAVITADPAGKVARAADPALTATVTGVAPGDTLNYRLERVAGEDVGTYPINVIPGDNPNYNVQTNQGVFTIAQKGIPASITVADQTYTSKEITPKPVVKDGATVLVEDQDYTLTYKNNVNAGTATVIVAGMGQYAGAQSVSFTIKRASATVAVDPATKLYGEDDPEFTAKVTGAFAGDKVDYSFTRESGEAIGSYTIDAVATASSNYDIQTVTAKLTIQPRQIPDGITAPADQTYEGKALTPKPVVRDGDATLVEGADYELSYQNNTAAGTATVTVTGKGNYAGSRSASFQIAKATATVRVHDAVKGMGDADPKFEATVEGLKGSDSLSYTLERAAGETAGEYPITAKPGVNPNYEMSSVDGMLTILPLPKGLKLSATELLLKEGESAELVVTFEPEGTASVLSFTSDDELVASVDGHGAIQALSAGVATITVATANGIVETCAVTVRPETEPLSVGLGDRKSLAVATARSAGTVSYTSSDEGVATVSETGVVTTKKEGTTRISAMLNGASVMEWQLTVTKAPTKVTLSAAKLSMGVEEILQLQAKPDTAEDSTVTWISSNKAVVSVDEYGLLTAHKTGSAKITAKTYNGKTAVCNVTVSKAPTSISLSQSEITLGAGDSATLTATLPKGTASAIYYSSSDEDVATVENGKVVAVALGTATITAKTYNGLSAECAVKVAPATTSIELGEDVTLGVNQKSKLQPKLDEGSMARLTYETSDKKIVTVTANGEIAGVKVGTATITVKDQNGLSDSVKVTVVAAPGKVTISATKASVGKGDTYQLTAQANASQHAPLTWSTNKATVATVDESGLVTAVGTGSARITVKTYNGKTASCTITVVKAPDSITLNKTEITLGAGDNATLTATLPKGTASTIQWSSSEEGVATVQDGKVVAVALGTAQITAKTYNGLSAVCTVKVAPATTSIELGDDVTLGVNQKTKLQPKLDEGSMAKLTYETSDKKIVTVTADGEISGVKVGTATITVKDQNGLSDSVKVTVVAAPGKVTISATKASVGKGDTYQLTAQANASQHAPLTWSTNKATVATVDANGLVTAVGTGSARITVKTYNGKTASCTVTVVKAPDSIALNKTEITLGAGDNATLTATLPKGTASTIQWSTSDEGVATVENGKVVAVALGTAQITAKTYNGLSAVCTVKVAPATTSIELGEDVTLGVNQKTKLQPKLDEGSMAKLTYETSDKKIVTVTADGEITGVKVGTATITVKDQNGLSDSVKVTVVAAPGKVTISATKATVNKGETYQLTAQANASQHAPLTWSTSKATVATVDENGLVTAVGTGSARITVKTYNGKTASCTITVVKAPETKD